jgi:hypothetical protein
MTSDRSSVNDARATVGATPAATIAVDRALMAASQAAGVLVGALHATNAAWYNASKPGTGAAFDTETADKPSTATVAILVISLRIYIPHTRGRNTVLVMSYSPVNGGVYTSFSIPAMPKRARW